MFTQLLATQAQVQLERTAANTHDSLKRVRNLHGQYLSSEATAILDQLIGQVGNARAALAVL